VPLPGRPQRPRRFALTVGPADALIRRVNVNPGELDHALQLEVRPSGRPCCGLLPRSRARQAVCGRTCASRRWAVVHCSWRRHQLLHTPRQPLQRQAFTGAAAESRRRFRLNAAAVDRGRVGSPIEWPQPSSYLPPLEPTLDWPDLARRAHPLLEAGWRCGRPLTTQHQITVLHGPADERGLVRLDAADREQARRLVAQMLARRGRCVRCRPADRFDVWVRPAGRLRPAR